MHTLADVPRRRCLLLLAVAGMLPFAATVARAQCQVTTTCWPPPETCAYAAPGPISFPSAPNGGPGAEATIGLRTLEIDSPTACVPLPLSGGSTVESFFDVHFMVEVSNYGETSWFPPSTGTAPCRVAIQPPAPVGGTLVFDTEMVQLDLSGGTLPSGHRIRESPSQASPGQITLQDLGGGLYRIDSFFDVFVELSVNDGQTWLPSSTPLHFTSIDRSQTPALAGTWGAVKIRFR